MHRAQVILQGLARRMSLWLAVGVTAAVALSVAVASWLLIEHHEHHAMSAARTSAEIHANLIQLALEHQMLEDERDLLRAMVQSFGRDPGVRNVWILDRKGKVRVASGPAPKRLDHRDATCKACHDRPPAEREKAVLLETAQGDVLRSVRPIPNRTGCHECHDPKHRINGVLLVDFDLTPVRAGLRHEVWMYAAGAISLALFLIGTFALLFRLLVARRLGRIAVGARAIAAGDLKRRLPEEGGDVVAWLARAFNALAAKGDALVTQVRDQRQQLEEILNGVDDGIVVLDPQLQVVAANAAFLRLHGVGRDEVLHRSCTAFGEGLCNPALCPALASFTNGGHRTEVLTLKGDDGNARFEEVRSSPLGTASGKPAYVVEVWRDITERRATEARLADNHRLASVGLLASGFSHEINTPLGTALACVDGLRRIDGDPAARADAVTYLEVARNELLRCRGITQQFLAFSRGQRTGTDLVDLATALSAVARIAAPTARDAGVELRVEPPAPPLLVRVAEADLQQVLMNLLLNGIQACSRGGKVEVGVSVAGAVVITVRDDGKGIERDDLPRVFEPFYGRRQGGTGLGLFLAREATVRWGGDLEVESEPGRGSQFRVRIPQHAVVGDMATG